MMRFEYFSFVCTMITSAVSLYFLTFNNQFAKLACKTIPFESEVWQWVMAEDLAFNLFQWFSNRGYFPPHLRGQMAADICGCPLAGVASGAIAI